MAQMIVAWRRPLLIGEAPTRRGDPAFAPGTVARAELATLLGLPDDDLDNRFELVNALDDVQPARGWGRGFDVDAAAKAIGERLAFGEFAARDVVALGWRVAAAMRRQLPNLPRWRGQWARGIQGGRIAWVRHPTCRTATRVGVRSDYVALGLAAA